MSFYKERLDEFTYNTYYIPFMYKIKSIHKISQEEFDLVEAQLQHHYHIFGSKLNELVYEDNINKYLMGFILPYRRNKNLNSLL